MSAVRILSIVAVCSTLIEAGSAQERQHANLLVDVSATLVNGVVAHSVDRTAAVDETILETPVRGTGRTVGTIRAELLPDDRRGMIDVIFRGYNCSRTVGERSSVFIYTTTTTTLDVRRRVIFDGQAIQGRPGPARGDAFTTLLGMQSRTFPHDWNLQLAQRVYQQSQDEAEVESGRKTAARVSQGIDEELTPTLTSLSRSIGRELKAFERAELKLEALDFRTTAKTLQASLRYSAPAYPPRPSGALPDGADLGVRIHETLANHESELELDGYAFKLDELSKVYLKVTRGLVIDGRKGVDAKSGLQKLEKMAAKLAGETVTITFARKAPMTLKLADQGFSVDFRFATLRQDKTVYAGVQVSAAYRFENAADGVHAVRIGAVKSVPFDEPAKDGKKLEPLPLKYRLLQNIVFSEVLTERLTLRLPPMPAALGKVRLQAPRAYARDGWFGLAWKASGN